MLDDLIRLVPPPPQVSFVPEWSVLSQKGISTPTEYRRLVETYGRGVFDDFLYVFVPGGENSNLDLGEQFERQLDALRELRREGHLRRSVSVFPEDGGLLPWGLTDNGDICFWDTSAETPEEWHVVIADDRASEWFEYRGGLTDFLCRVFSQPQFCPVFPDDWPTDAPSFSEL